MLTDALAKLNGGIEPDLVATRSGRQRAKFAQSSLQARTCGVGYFLPHGTQAQTRS